MFACFFVCATKIALKTTVGSVVLSGFALFSLLLLAKWSVKSRKHSGQKSCGRLAAGHVGGIRQALSAITAGLYCQRGKKQEVRLS